jgi:hypothetical protein
MVYRRILLILSLFTFSCAAYGQALPTADRNLQVQIGGAVSLGNPDYDDKDIKGVSLFVDLDYGAHWGIEGDIHDITISTPQDIGQSSALLNIRYKLNYGKIHPHIRAGAGLAYFDFDKGFYPANSSTSYGVYDIGAGVDYSATRKLHIRVLDFEYQDWKNFPPNGLTPYILSIGAAYNF